MTVSACDSVYTAHRCTVQNKGSTDSAREESECVVLRSY